MGFHVVFYLLFILNVNLKQVHMIMHIILSNFIKFARVRPCNVFE